MSSRALEDESVDLTVTSPLYFNLKDYDTPESQVVNIADYQRFIELSTEV